MFIVLLLASWAWVGVSPSLGAAPAASSQSLSQLQFEQAAPADSAIPFTAAAATQAEAAAKACTGFETPLPVQRKCHRAVTQGATAARSRIDEGSGKAIDWAAQAGLADFVVSGAATLGSTVVRHGDAHGSRSVFWAVFANTRRMRN